MGVATSGQAIVGIGTDLVEIDRIAVTISRTPRFVHRVFSEAEQAYALAAASPAERFAVRFAAKEAVLKAMGLGLGGAALADIEVHRNEATGQPFLQLVGSAQTAAQARDITQWHLSLSHTKTMAQAFVVAVGSAVVEQTTMS